MPSQAPIFFKNGDSTFHGVPFRVDKKRHNHVEVRTGELASLPQNAASPVLRAPSSRRAQSLKGDLGSKLIRGKVFRIFAVDSKKESGPPHSAPSAC